MRMLTRLNQTAKAAGLVVRQHLTMGMRYSYLTLPNLDIEQSTKVDERFVRLGLRATHAFRSPPNGN